MAKKKASFYAVARGRTPGLYGTWPECEKQVTGFSGAKYQSFSALADAQAFMREHGAGSAAIPPAVSTSSVITVPVTRNIAAPAATRPAPASSSVITVPVKRKAVEQVRPETSAHAQNASASSSKAAPNTYAPTSGARVINVYTDGASAGNGKAKAKAGWGVWFEDPQLQHLNRAGRLAGEMQTNNRAELTAIIRACQLCPRTGARLQIYTDSQYSIKAIQEWQDGWRRRLWRTANMKAVLNKDLIRLLERELRKHKPRPHLIYVKGHAGHAGNEAADQLAVEGARMASVPRSEWTDFEPPDSGCSDEEEPVAAKHSASTSEQSSSHAAERQAATPEPVPRKRQRLALQEDLFRLDDDENDGSDEPVRILAADEQSAAELEGLGDDFFANDDELAALERGDE